MTAVLSTRCRRCGAELTDRFSRKLGYGPECRKDLTPDQLADAIRTNQPGYVPRTQPPRPASVQARANRAEIARVTAPDVTAKRCAHDGTPGSCPLCRHEADPWKCAQRIIAITQRMPMDQRLAAQRAAAIRRYNPTTHQLTIGDPR